MPGRRLEQREVEFELLLAAAHGEFWRAFEKAMSDAGCKNAEAARGMNVSANTVTNYLKRRTPVNGARVLAYKRLRKPFLRALCGEHRDPAPYIARKRGAK